MKSHRETPHGAGGGVGVTRLQLLEHQGPPAAVTEAWDTFSPGASK